MVLKTTKTSRAIIVTIMIYIIGILFLIAIQHTEFIPVWVVAFDVGLVTGGLVAIYLDD